VADHSWREKNLRERLLLKIWGWGGARGLEETSTIKKKRCGKEGSRVAVVGLNVYRDDLPVEGKSSVFYSHKARHSLNEAGGRGLLGEGVMGKVAVSKSHSENRSDVSWI